MNKLVKKWWLIGLIVFVALIVRVVFSSLGAALWWDEAIYIGMAKHIFSNGNVGFWENFRPPIFPIFLGFGWWSGLDILAWGRTLEIFAGTTIIALTYFISEHVKKGVGLISTSLLVFLPALLSFGSLMLSGIPATAFALLGIYFLLKKKWFTSGIFLAVASLTRFTHGLVIIGVGVAFLAEYFFTEISWKEAWAKWWSFGVGAIIVFIPYLIANIIMFENPIWPFLEASHVIRDFNNFYYESSNLYYLSQVWLQSPVLFFSLIGVVYYAVKKKFREFSWNVVLFPALAFLIYFLTLQHKEVRFFLPLFAFLAIFSAVGIRYSLSFLKSKRACKILLILIIVFSLVWSIISSFTVIPTTQYPQEQNEFLKFFFEEKEGLLISSNAMHIPYSDMPITFLRNWNLSFEVWNRYGDKATYVAIDDCDYPCSQEDDVCKNNRESFINSLSKFKRVFDKSYHNNNGDLCNVMIWKIR